MLETVDGAAVSPTTHRCVCDVFARLAFPNGGGLAGVIGVPLAD